MKIGIDARMIDWSGVGRYTKNLILGIKEFGADIEPLLFCNEANANKIPDSVEFKKYLINTPVYSLSAPVRLANKLKRHELDLYHATHFVVPSNAKYPIVVTIHDLIPLIIKQTMPNALHRRYYHMQNSMACRKAKKIIVDSQSTKNDVIRIFGVPEDKIEVIYLSAQGIFRIISDKQVEEVKEKFAIKGEYILAPGNQKPSKGIEYLIDAYHKLKSERKLEHDLVLTGLPSEKFKGVVNKIARYSLSESVRFIGQVSDDELVALYNGASVFVFPSLYEGFGLPPLEAMACETPVIASNRSSVPEVVGDAALIVDPCNTNEFADALDGVFDDQNLRSQLVERGLKRINEFSFEKFARATIAVYEKVLRN